MSVVSWLVAASSLSATMLEAADDLQPSGLFWSYMQQNI